VPFVFEAIDVGGQIGRSEVAHNLSAGWPRPGPRSRAAENPTIRRFQHWPVYTAADRATLVLDRECRSENDYGRETRSLWKEIAGV
jgi:carboxylesterase type B